MNKDTCKHYGGAFHDKTCRAGVAFADVTPEWETTAGQMLRLPCHTKPYPNATPVQLEHHAKRGTCAKFEAPTDAEIAESKREIEAAVQRVAKTIPLISRVKKEHEGKQWAGVETCPICGGRLHLTHSSFNGHVWGRCGTADCLAWME